MKSRVFMLALLAALSAQSALAAVRATIFAAGAHGRDYDFLSEGASIDLALGSRVALLTRASGNHLYTDQSIELALGTPGVVGKQHSFARFQGGFRLAILRELQLEAVAGVDRWGSTARSGQASLSWQTFTYSDHQLLLTGSGALDDKTHIATYGMNARVSLTRALGLVWLGSVGGQVLEGKLLGRNRGRAGGGLMALHLRTNTGLEVTGGGGYGGAYYGVTMFQSFDF